MFDLPFIGYLYNKSSIHYAARKYMLMVSQNCHQLTEKLKQIFTCFKLNFVNLKKKKGKKIFCFQSKFTFCKYFKSPQRRLQIS